MAKTLKIRVYLFFFHNKRSSDNLSLMGAFFPKDTPEPVLDFSPERGSAKGTMADFGPF